MVDYHFQVHRHHHCREWQYVFDFDSRRKSIFIRYVRCSANELLCSLSIVVHRHHHRPIHCVD